MPTRPLHPFLFALYPVLALLAYNLESAGLGSAIRPALLSLAGAGLLFALLHIITRSSHRAALLTTLLLALFFSYGHFYNFLEGPALLGGALGRHRLLAPAWVLLAGLILFAGLRTRKPLAAATAPLNWIAAALLILPIIQVITYQVRASAPPSPGQVAGTPNLQIAPGAPTPDIYYIILDGYSRDDMLTRYYDYDNREFITALQQMGFYVAPCSQSNYAQTQLSLASSLNYNYLDALGSHYALPNTSRNGLSDLIRHSAVRQSLESLGYTTVAFDTGYDATRLEDAGVYLSPGVSAEINDFENLLVRTTFLRVFSEGLTLLNLPPDWEARDQAYRQRILYSLDELQKMPALPGPKFVFAHIIAPHWPHVFGPDGQPVHERPDSQAGYRNQVIFINKRILPILQALLRDSAIPPVILLQGDHGAVIEDPQRRMVILNAYYLPGGSPQLYESVSPVNSFRLVFNQLFSGNLPILEDVSYYSRYEDPYRYQQVSVLREGCK